MFEKWNIAPIPRLVATGTSILRTKTPMLSLILAILWTCILISVAGFKEHAWYLVGISELGMLQHVYATGAARAPSTSCFHLKKFSRMPTIIGKRQKEEDDPDSIVNLEKVRADVSGLNTWQLSLRQCEANMTIYSQYIYRII
jgi:hypothetical protein